MSTTPVSAFTDHAVSFLRDTVVAPLCEWLRDSKNVEVTIDEMVQVLHLPMKAPIGPISVQTLRVPGLLSSIASEAAPVRTLRKKAPADGPKCEYRYTKGEKVGNPCGKNAESTPLGPRCTTHTGKQGGPPKDGKGVVANPAAQGLPLFGATASAPAAAPPSRELQVVKIQGSNLLKETTMGAILYQPSERVIYAVGMDDGEGGYRAPTEQEVDMLKARGVPYRPEALQGASVANATPTPVQAPVAMPAMPAMPTIPTMPAVPGMPMMPSFPMQLA